MAQTPSEAGLYGGKEGAARHRYLKKLSIQLPRKIWGLAILPAKNATTLCLIFRQYAKRTDHFKTMLEVFDVKADGLYQKIRVHHPA